jgi:hypothetical protein
VKNFRVIRLNELLAEYLSIGLFGFARVDGILLDAGTHPVKKLRRIAEIKSFFNTFVYYVYYV